MKVFIAQWAGAKGVGLRMNKSSITIHSNLLASFRIRKHYSMDKWYQYLFWVYKNRRLSLNEWDLDIVILGFMIQIQKYKPLYWNSKGYDKI